MLLLCAVLCSVTLQSLERLCIIHWNSNVSKSQSAQLSLPFANSAYSGWLWLETLSAFFFIRCCSFSIFLLLFDFWFCLLPCSPCAPPLPPHSTATHRSGAPFRLVQVSVSLFQHFQTLISISPARRQHFFSSFGLFVAFFLYQAKKYWTSQVRKERSGARCSVL